MIVKNWIATATLVGIVYAAVGILFAIPTSNVRVWRLASWFVSAVAYGTYILYERFRLGSTPVATASHVAVAAAIGGFGLAVGANIHSMVVSGPNQHHTLLRVSLVIWPIATAVPAFLVALAISWALARVQRRNA